MTATSNAIEPVTIPYTLVEDERQTSIRILHRPDRRLVTVIEILSPTNKSGDGYRDYLVRRAALRRQDIGLVEIDLLLGGRRLPMERPLPPGDYYAFVSTAERRPDCDVYARSVRRPLPTLPIPLRHPDPPVPLDLAAVFATTYDRARYGRSVDYAKPLGLAMADVDRAWALEIGRAVAG